VCVRGVRVRGSLSLFLFSSHSRSLTLHSVTTKHSFLSPILTTL
jgi:hypothetical protein